MFRSEKRDRVSTILPDYPYSLQNLIQYKQIISGCDPENDEEFYCMNRFINRYGTLIAIAAGIMFLFFGMIRSVSFFTYRSTEAVVISYEEEYDTVNETVEPTAIVEYEVDGKRYETELDDYTQKYYVGKTVKIKYDPNDPQKIITASFVLPLIQIGFGALCIFGGIVGLANRR